MDKPIKLKVGNTANIPTEEWHAETQEQLEALEGKIPVGSTVQYFGNNKLEIYKQLSTGLIKI